MYPTGGGRRRCPVCGAPHHGCGAPTSTTPVDERVMIEEAPVGELRQYHVKVNGHDTILKLSANDAEKLYPEATLVTPATVAAPRARARTTPNKARLATENK